jgi:hypothetical protein
VARQLLGVPGDAVEDCLAQQRRTGGRLGDLLRGRGVITRGHVKRTLKYQARWMARATQQDVRPVRFPYLVCLSVCLPAYNEAANIEDTLDAACAILPEFVESFEIVVVDDGSKDDTTALVARYAREHPQVRLVRHEVNRGYGAAVSTGLRAARVDLVMFTDSDGQFCLLDLPQLLARLAGHDAVLGYRYRRADHRLRLFNAWAWNRLIRLVLGGAGPRPGLCIQGVPSRRDRAHRDDLDRGGHQRRNPGPVHPRRREVLRGAGEPLPPLCGGSDGGGVQGDPAGVSRAAAVVEVSEADR